MAQLSVDTDIKKAKTLHSDFYTTNEYFEAAKKKYLPLRGNLLVVKNW
jgi:hypothetical protein